MLRNMLLRMLISTLLLAVVKDPDLPLPHPPPVAVMVGEAISARDLILGNLGDR